MERGQRAVQECVDTEGFGPWPMKADVLHVQHPGRGPGAHSSMRLHLDNCREENGALRVIPGSHLHGRIPEGMRSFSEAHEA